jgi:hypothetical protein
MDLCKLEQSNKVITLYPIKPELIKLLVRTKWILAMIVLMNIRKNIGRKKITIS